MDKKEKIENYLKRREDEFEKLSQEIRLLRAIKIPLKVREYGEGFELFSEDYTRAEDFKIQKRSEHISGVSGYEGGYSTDRYETYPQFYFNLKSAGLVKPVYIQHDDFEKDKRVVIRSITDTRGSADFANMTSKRENDVDLGQVFGFFRQRGVRESLLKKLELRIKQAGEI